jgi:hypothetical protein
MGAASIEACHQFLAQAKGQPLQGVRAIRDEIHDRVKELIRSECAECCNVL